MAYNQVLKVTAVPKISTKEIFAPDTSGVNGQNFKFKAPKNSRATEESIGSDAPYIMINTVPIASIEKMIIDETGTIPTIRITFIDPTGALSGPNYPKTDPIMSVYIKTANGKFKSIAGDFLITSIKSSLDPNEDPGGVGINATYVMSGELYVPKLYNNFSKSYSNLTSVEALRVLADDLDLGFSELDISTNDAMTWINPNRNGLWMINHISKHAYIDENQFFDSFIDRYYNLTFVNISNQLVQNQDYDNTYTNNVDGSGLYGTQEMKEREESNWQENVIPMMLTNEDRMRGRPDYITNYLLEGEPGRVLKAKGFRKQISYYDHILDEEDKKTEFWVNPIKINGQDDASRLIPKDKILQDNLIKQWMSIDYGNNHREWNGAALINDHNLAELNKVKLKIETLGVNFQIVRGASVPINIFKTIQQAIDQESYLYERIRGENRDIESNDLQNIIIDPYLSGTYYNSGVRILYDSTDKFGPFRTEFHMKRMNWLVEKTYNYAT
jgi:hypothetical protein